VRTLQLREIPRDGERRVEAEEAEALLVAERWDVSIQPSGEARLRQQVQRIRVREELPECGKDPAGGVRIQRRLIEARCTGATSSPQS
jgi:hypothetical protein